MFHLVRKRSPLAMMALIFVFSASVGWGSDVAVLVQHTPPQGGDTTPGAGVYHFQMDSDIALTAIPKPGFEFRYWLGDVADPSALTTRLTVNKPKIIVAVFAPTTVEEVIPLTAGAAGEVQWLGVGGAFPARVEFSSSSYSPGGSQESNGGNGDEGDIPEPATLALLAMGSLVMARRRKTAS